MSLIRLLQRKPDGEIVFREPTPGGDVPAYAILSHTWGEEEVIYEDWKECKNTSKVINKAGWRKIQFCANQAAIDGLEYFWVDTCCIDKKSSSELTEAINSMYMWYELAAICYVYLVDMPGGCPRLVETRTRKVITAELVDCDTGVAEPLVLQGSGKTQRPVPSQSDLPPMDDDDDEDGARLHQGVWVLHLRVCRWFSRGWTLQELIAPKRLVFFGMGWNFIGSKLDLLYTLSDITGIDPIALSHRCNLEELSIAKRLSWAARRKTTRIEDTAYSLLGLLNINMTLLYGEGEKAFTRLQEEIIRKSADSSVFAWFRGAKYGLLAPSPAYFGSCSKVILCSGGTVAHSFELTHRGLRMKLRILKQRSKGNTFLAVLNCRMEDEFERVLCLHLKEQMADPTDSVSSTGLGCHSIAFDRFERFRVCRISHSPASAS
ncbi:Vegetative incompatibility protein HET-E-1 [Lachnellula suecica]|uniref:Vegetative incompatibility protein HET-E-1 n=1 Tax=Lachnellula suecica TaxID=602035 RepID=A0A8T9CDL3_9HELO|nr:Vegetative incompatibility protein HET-E-1 [Lachnellula suecica]